MIYIKSSQISGPRDALWQHVYHHNRLTHAHMQTYLHPYIYIIVAQNISWRMLCWRKLPWMMVFIVWQYWCLYWYKIHTKNDVTNLIIVPHHRFSRLVWFFLMCPGIIWTISDRNSSRRRIGWHDDSALPIIDDFPLPCLISYSDISWFIFFQHVSLIGN